MRKNRKRNEGWCRRRGRGGSGGVRGGGEGVRRGEVGGEEGE